MKKMLSVVMALVLALSMCQFAFAEAAEAPTAVNYTVPGFISTAAMQQAMQAAGADTLKSTETISVNTENLYAMLGMFGMEVTDEMKAQIDPVLAIVNNLGVVSHASANGGRMDVQLQGRNILSSAAYTDENGLMVITTDLLPNYYLTYDMTAATTENTDTAAQLAQLKALFEGVDFSGYVTDLQGFAAAIPSTTEDGEYVVNGVTYTQKGVIALSYAQVSDLVLTLMTRLKSDTALMGALATLTGSSADEMTKSLEETLSNASAETVPEGDCATVIAYMNETEKYLALVFNNEGSGLYTRFNMTDADGSINNINYFMCAFSEQEGTNEEIMSAMEAASTNAGDNGFAISGQLTSTLTETSETIQHQMMMNASGIPLVYTINTTCDWSDLAATKMYSDVTLSFAGMLDILTVNTTVEPAAYAEMPALGEKTAVSMNIENPEDTEAMQALSTALTTDLSQYGLSNVLANMINVMPNETSALMQMLMSATQSYETETTPTVEPAEEIVTTEEVQQ